MAGDWTAVGREVRRARGPRWRTQRAFARATGLSVKLISDLETGARDNFAPATKRVIEETVGWRPGTVDRIAASGKLPRDEDPQFTRLSNVWPYLSEKERAMVVAVAESTREPRG